MEFFQDAIPVFTEAIQESPTNPKFYFYRGVCYGNWFKSANAIADYNKAIELDPTYMEAYGNRANEKGNLLTTQQKSNLTPELTKSICEDLDKCKQLGGNKNGELDDLIYIYCERPKGK
jgi:tetratricopeptide (TPR) repeat protein